MRARSRCSTRCAVCSLPLCSRAESRARWLTAKTVLAVIVVLSEIALAVCILAGAGQEIRRGLIRRREAKAAGHGG